VKCHKRALPTLSANDGPRFHTNIPVSEVIEHETQAVEAIAKTEDGVTRETQPTPIRP